MKIQNNDVKTITSEDSINPDLEPQQTKQFLVKKSKAFAKKSNRREALLSTVIATVSSGVIPTNYNELRGEAMKTEELPSRKMPPSGTKLFIFKKNPQTQHRKMNSRDIPFLEDYNVLNREQASLTLDSIVGTVAPNSKPFMSNLTP